MPKLLRIDASSRIQDSHSRELADYFVEHWLKSNPESEIVVRDLIQEPVPHISECTIAGFYMPKSDHDETLRQSTCLSDELIREVMTADTLLIDTPMYNFSVPSVLKAWIDQVVRIGETFSFSPDRGFEGLVTGKQAFVITASGAVFSVDAMQPLDYLTPYLRTLLGFLGITEVEFIALEGTTTDEAVFNRSRQTAKKRIAHLEIKS